MCLILDKRIIPKSLVDGRLVLTSRLHVSNTQITSRNFLVVAAIVISEVVPGHRDLGVGGGLLLGIHRCLWGRGFLLLR